MFVCLFFFYIYIVIQLSDDTYASLLSVMADIQYIKVTYTMLIKEGDLILKHLFLNQPHTPTTLDRSIGEKIENKTYIFLLYKLKLKMKLNEW